MTVIRRGVWPASCASRKQARSVGVVLRTPPEMVLGCDNPVVIADQHFAVRAVSRPWEAGHRSTGMPSAGGRRRTCLNCGRWGLGEIRFRGRGGGCGLSTAALLVVTPLPANTARSPNGGRAGAASDKRARVDPMDSPA